MKLPNTFTVGGFTFKVIQDCRLAEKRDGLKGLAVHERNLILVDTSSENEEIICQTFLHELVHVILNVMGKGALRDDEEFVNTFSHLLMQSMKEMIGDGVPVSNNIAKVAEAAASEMEGKGDE